MRFARLVFLVAAASRLMAVTISSECSATNRQALALVVAQRTVEAEAQLSQLATKLGGSADNKVCLAVTLSNLSQVLERLGKLGAAEQAALRSVNLLEETVGPRDPLLRTPLHFLAQTAVRKEELHKADKLLSRAESLPGATHADLASMKGLRADLLMRAGTFPEAEETYRESIAESELAGRGTTREIVPDLANLALLYINNNRVSDALPLLQRSVSLTDSPFADIDTRVETRLLFAIGLARKKDNQRAEGYFQQAIELLGGLPAEVRPRLGRSVYLHYAAFLHDTGHKREGNSFKQKAQALFGCDSDVFTISVDSLLSKR